MRHVFMWQTIPSADDQQVLRILDELPTKVPEVVGWTRGKSERVQPEAGDEWEFCLVCDFESWADLRRYYDAPFHSEVNAKLMPVMSARAVCDFEF